MPTQNFRNANNAQGTLLSSLSAGAGSLTLQTGQGALFPSVFPFPVEIKEVDTIVNNYRVLKREIALCTNRSGDALTLGTRAYEPCPLSYSAVTQTQTAQNFNNPASTIVTASFTAWVAEDIRVNKTNREDLQNQAHVYALDTGSANAYSITLSPAPSAYATGQSFQFKAANTNTGASTINVNGLGVKTLKKYASGVYVDLGPGDILSGQIMEIVYDGTNFQVTSNLPESVPSDLMVLGEATAQGDALTTESFYPALVCDSQINFGNATGTQKIAFRFIGNGINMTSLNLWLKKVGTPADNVTVDIFADSSGPTGASLSSGTFAGGSLTTSTADTAVTMSSFTPTDKTPYWVVLGRSGALDGANYFQVAVHTDDTIAFPYRINNSGVWGSPLTTESPSIYANGFYSDVVVRARATAYKFSKVLLYSPSALSLYGTIARIARGVYSGLSGLKGGKVYYLSNTAGAISLTPGTIVSQAGRAQNSTTIELFDSNRNLGLESITTSNTTSVYTTTKYMPRGGVVRMSTSGANGGNATAYLQYSIDEGANWIETNNVAAWGSAWSGAFSSSLVEWFIPPGGWVRGRLGSTSNPNNALMTWNFYFFPL